MHVLAMTLIALAECQIGRTDGSTNRGSSNWLKVKSGLRKITGGLAGATAGVAGVVTGTTAVVLSGAQAAVEKAEENRLDGLLPRGINAALSFTKGGVLLGGAGLTLGAGWVAGKLLGDKKKNAGREGDDSEEEDGDEDEEEGEDDEEEDNEEDDGDDKKARKRKR